MKTTMKALVKREAKPGLSLEEVPVPKIGINDVLGADPAGAPFSTHVFSVFDAWATQTGNTQAAARASIARGQNIFNTRTFNISGVRGVNDALGVPNLTGTCTTCHDAPNAGDHSIPMPLDIGVADGARRTPDMPLYTLQCSASGAAAGRCAAGQTMQTTDPGRGLITGQWRLLNSFKVPGLRNLSARPPYFHNGSAATLRDVVDFYVLSMKYELTPSEKDDLVAFLSAL